MSILNDRIKELRLARGYTLLEVAKKLGVKEATVQRYESGEIKNIKNQTIERLATIFGCSPEYLMGWDSQLNETLYPVDEDQFVSIPILERCSGNMNYFDESNIKGYDKVLKTLLLDDSNYMFLKIVGDSMYPMFLENDLVLVQCQRSVTSDSFAVVMVDDEDGVIKKVVHGQGFVELHSVNPMYQVRRFEGEDVKRIKYAGLVKGVHRRME